ncbi:mucin-2-like [Saccostrea cucullata]|uniref:mucin-2-like n=1 Tax=Saccostrea cuccullata TaxID=36930 RepID=UPI002ED20188
MDTSDCPRHLSKCDLYVYGDYCLKVHYGDYDWETARKLCLNEGADLVQPRTSGIQEYIRVSLLPQKQRSEEDGFWIGATDLNSESHWRWVSGDPRMPYSNWESGQGPSQSGFLFAAGDLEDCALMKIQDGFRWHDYPCSNFFYHYSFICQHKKIPRSTQAAHFNHTHPTPTTTKYVPPTTTKYVPPTTTKYVPPTTTKYVPPITTKYVPPTTTKFDPETFTTTRFVPWTEKTTMLSEKTRSSTDQMMTDTPLPSTTMNTNTPLPSTTPEEPSKSPSAPDGSGGDPFSVGFASIHSLPADNCPSHLSKSDLYTYGDFCLKVHYGNYDWDDARHKCRQEGGDLVQIRDSGMQHFLQRVLSGQRSEEDGFWIGASDRDSESHWKWVSGDPRMSYSNWESGQGPSQSGFFLASGTIEDCALMRVDSGFRWHDYDCSSIFYHYSFICQYSKLHHTTPGNHHTDRTTSKPQGSTTVFINLTSPDTTPFIPDTTIYSTPPKTDAPIDTTPPPTDAPVPTTPPETDAPLPTTDMFTQAPFPTTMLPKTTPQPTTTVLTTTTDKGGVVIIG